MARGGKRNVMRPVPPMLVKPEAWAAWSVEERPIGELVPYARNARTHSQAQIDQLMVAIARYGWTAPVLVDETGMILAGHGRVLAAKRLGLATVPVMTAAGWDDAQKRAYILADNKIAANAGWDKDLLAGELEHLLATLPEIDLGDLGFRKGELDRLLPDVHIEGRTDPDTPTAPKSDRPPVSRRGDIWLLGDHRLMCGDCTVGEHVDAVLAGERPKLMVTDPPYGVDYDPDWRNRADELGWTKGGIASGTSERATGQVENDARADWRQAWELYAGDVAYVWHGALHSSEVEASLRAVKFEPRAQIIWAKERFVVSRGHYHWQHEPCWYVVREGAANTWHGDRSQATLWTIAHRKSETGHGTQKPVECMRRPIVNSSQAGDAVYEPFSGSGTTIIAAEMTGRRCRAIEISPAYVDVAVRRWEDFTGNRAILAAGEQTMEEARAARGGEMQKPGLVAGLMSRVGIGQS